MDFDMGCFRGAVVDPEELRSWLRQESELLSPIDLRLVDSVPIVLPELMRKHFHHPPERAKITNNGWTVVLSGKWKGVRPYIFGGPLSDKYVFSMLHFHWAENDTQGSEHTVDGQEFPLEMHVVYFKAKYAYFEEAAKHDDGIVFEVHFFYIQPDDNIQLETVIGNLGSICKPGTSTKVKDVALNSFIVPFTSDYLVYAGRVMAQKGGHKITWLICRRPTGVSHKQMIRFRTICGKDGRSLLRNIHYLHELGNRRIYHVNVSDYLIGIIYPYPRPLPQKSNKLRLQFHNIPSPISSQSPTHERSITRINQIKKEFSKTSFQSKNIYSVINRISGDSSSTLPKSFFVEEINKNFTQALEKLFQESGESSFSSVSNLLSGDSKLSTAFTTDMSSTKTHIQSTPKEEEAQVSYINAENIREILSLLMEEHTKKIIDELKVKNELTESRKSSSIKTSNIDREEFSNSKSMHTCSKNTRIKERLDHNKKCCNTLTDDNTEYILPSKASLKNQQKLNDISRAKDELHPCQFKHAWENQTEKPSSCKVSLDETSNESLQQNVKIIENEPSITKPSALKNIRKYSANDLIGKLEAMESNHRVKKQLYSEIGEMSIYKEESSEEYQILMKGDNENIALSKKLISSEVNVLTSEKIKYNDLRKNSKVKIKKHSKDKSQNKPKKDTLGNMKTKPIQRKGSVYVIVEKRAACEKTSVKNKSLFSALFLAAKDVLICPFSYINDFRQKKSNCKKANRKVLGNEKVKKRHVASGDNNDITKKRKKKTNAKSPLSQK